jgi:hypothetical protein
VSLFLLSTGVQVGEQLGKFVVRLTLFLRDGGESSAHVCQLGREVVDLLLVGCGVFSQSTILLLGAVELSLKGGLVLNRLEQKEVRSGADISESTN